jgi:hypothetical protein
MKRAIAWYPPESFTKFELSRNAPAPAAWLRLLSAVSILALALVALATTSFAQRGGSRSTPGGSQSVTQNVASASHVSEDVRISNNEERFTSSTKASIPSESKGATAELLLESAGEQSENLPVASHSAPRTEFHFESAETESVDKQAPASLSPATIYPREVVVGFPPPPAESEIASKTLREGRPAVTDQRNELSAESPQHGAAPHAGAPIRGGGPIRSAPVTTARPGAAPPGSIRGMRFTPPVRPRSTARPFSFLETPRATGAPHVFGPRRGRPRFFGGFGFFPFGFEFPFFAFGFEPECNPFWAWPWAFGCATFGYWNGYDTGLYGGINANVLPPEEQPEIEQPPEEPETFTYIPPAEPSSPEEIEAEKILVVLYMKNGAVYAVTNYWIADGKLHYLTSYGGENAIDLKDLDLQKTVDVNASRGVEFTLKPAPTHKEQKPQPPPNQPNPPGWWD